MSKEKREQTMSKEEAERDVESSMRYLGGAAGWEEWMMNVYDVVEICDAYDLDNTACQEARRLKKSIEERKR